MKKFLVFITVLALLLSASACGKSEDNDSGKSDAQNGNVGQTEQPHVSGQQGETTQNVESDSWGVTDQYEVFYNGTEVSYCINVPYYSASNVGRGILCEQADGTMTLVSGQRDYSPEVNSIAEVFPACNEQVEYTFVSAYGLLAEDFVFTYEKSEPVTIGDYEMHTFEGELSFVNDTTPMHFTFVAYATQLKSNGGYAYWAVFDITDDLSAGDLIAEHAYNMALTFREKV